MKCRELKIEIQQYSDGELLPPGLNELESHLDSCPLCRAELDAVKSLRNELGLMKRVQMSPFLLSKIRSQVAAEVTPDYGFPVFRLIEGTDSWTRKWLWPTAFGTVTSLVFGLFLLAVIMIPSDVPQLAISTEDSNYSEDSVFFARTGNSIEQLITPQEFANSRSDFSHESPSLNPAGTLVNIGQSETRDDEAVVVADVYGNGSAQITDVVESSRDRKMMDRLMAAFRPDRSAPPFVPANLDNRESVVRVVLKFQNVNVNIEEASVIR